MNAMIMGKSSGSSHIWYAHENSHWRKPVLVISRESPSEELFPYVHNRTKMKFSDFGEAFSVMSPFRKHISNQSREKPCECNQYRESFPCSSSFTMVKRVVSGEDLQEHNQYWKAFIALSSCRQQKRIHTEQKSYECNQWVRAISLSLGNGWAITPERDTSNVTEVNESSILHKAHNRNT